MTSPLPDGAGIRVTRVDADVPVALYGTELPGPADDSHEPFPLDLNYV